MIVNVNPCASTYDETLHVAKFSAIASQVRSCSIGMMVVLILDWYLYLRKLVGASYGFS